MRGKECLKWMIDNQNEWLYNELSNRFTKAMFNGYEFVRVFDGETEPRKCDDLSIFDCVEWHPDSLVSEEEYINRVPEAGGERVEIKRDKTSDITISIPENLIEDRDLHLEISINGKGI